MSHSQSVPLPTSGREPATANSAEIPNDGSIEATTDALVTMDTVSDPVAVVKVAAIKLQPMASTIANFWISL